MPLRDYKYKLRDLANAKNLSIDWDAKNKAVSIGGQPFDTTGWQNIDGRFKGTEAMASQFLKNFNVPSGNIAGLPPQRIPEQKPIVMQAPTGNVQDTTTPKYSNEINSVTNQLGEAVQGFGEPYDLDSDPIYKALADYQRSQMMQMAGRRGMAFDDNTKARIAQSNMLLGQQFQQQDQLRQLQNIQNLQGQLGTLTGLEDRAMQNQFTLEDRQFQKEDRAMQNQFILEDRQFQKEDRAMNLEDRAMNLEDRSLARDQSIYGIALTPQTRDYMNTMQNITLEQRQYINQYSDNFAAQINNLPEGDERRSILEAARFQKVISDPVEYRDYLINEYGLSPFQVDNIVVGRKLEELQAMATNEKDAMELERLRLQVEKAGVDLQRAGVGLTKDEISSQKAYYETIMSQVKASNLDAQLKANLNNTFARTYNTNLKSEIDMMKLEEKLDKKSNEPLVQQGFIDFVASGLSFDEWLDTPVNVSDTFSFSNKEGERPVYYTEILTPKQIAEVAKVAKSAGFFAETSGITINMGDLPSYTP